MLAELSGFSLTFVINTKDKFSPNKAQKFEWSNFYSEGSHIRFSFTFDSCN